MRAQENQATSLASHENPITQAGKGRTKDKRIPQPVVVLPARLTAPRGLPGCFLCTPVFLTDALQFPMHPHAEAAAEPYSTTKPSPSRLHKADSTKRTPLSGLRQESSSPTHAERQKGVCEAVSHRVRVVTRHTAYNKHDTGWAKGAPSEDHTNPPSSRTASGGRLVGGGCPQAPARFGGG
jgi:hypothetical protein